MPLTNKYQPKVPSTDPLFSDVQWRIRCLQDQIFDAIFGAPKDPKERIAPHPSVNPVGVNPLFNSHFIKARARAYPGDPRVYFYVEIPEVWIFSFIELPFKNLEYGESGPYDIKKPYRNFVVRVGFQPGMSQADEEGLSDLAKTMCAPNKCGEVLVTQAHVHGIEREHWITEEGQRRKIYVSILAVKPRVEPLFDAVEKIARYPSLVDDLTRQMLQYRSKFERLRLGHGRNFQYPHQSLPDQPFMGFMGFDASSLDRANPAFPSSDLSQCHIRLPPGGIPKNTRGDYHSMKRLVHILSEVSPSSANTNVTIEDSTSFRIFIGDTFPATEFTYVEIQRLAMTFALVYDFSDFSQILVRESSKRIDPVSRKPFWEIKHIHGTARFEPLGLDLVRWDTQFPLHLPAHAAFYASFRRQALCLNPLEMRSPALRSAFLRYAQTMHDLWTKSYKGMCADEEKQRRALLRKVQAAGWTYKGVERGWKKTVGGSLRRAFR